MLIVTKVTSFRKRQKRQLQSFSHICMNFRSRLYMSLSTFNGRPTTFMSCSLKPFSSLLTVILAFLQTQPLAHKQVQLYLNTILCRSLYNFLNDRRCYWRRLKRRFLFSIFYIIPISSKNFSDCGVAMAVFRRLLRACFSATTVLKQFT